MNTKEQIYRELVKNEHPDRIEDTWKKLDLFNHSDEINTRIQEQDIVNILQRYLSEQLSDQQIEDWAGYLECTNFETGNIGNENITDIIYELANPVLEGALTPARAQEYITKLQKK